MTPRVDRANRVLLIVIGAVVLGTGTALLLRSGGALGADVARSSVVSAQTTSFVQDNQHWLWPTAAVLMLAIVAVCIWWVGAQLRSQPVSQLELERSAAGNTVVSGHALADCLERDCDAIPGVARSKARVTAEGTKVTVNLTAWVGAPYDLNKVVLAITNDVLPHLAKSLAGTPLRPSAATIHLEATAAPVSRLA